MKNWKLEERDVLYHQCEYLDGHPRGQKKDAGPTNANAMRHSSLTGKQKSPPVFQKPCWSSNSSTSKLLLVLRWQEKVYIIAFKLKHWNHFVEGFSGNCSLPGTGSLGVFSSAHWP